MTLITLKLNTKKLANTDELIHPRSQQIVGIDKKLAFADHSRQFN